MADAQNAPAPEEVAPQAAEQQEKPSPAAKKKKKKSGKGLKFLFILFILGIGACVGLQVSGGADLRPFVYTIVPRLPIVGESLTELLNVPDVYSLSPEERRKIELDEWELSIAERKRSLDEQDESIQALSSDLRGKEMAVDETQRELQKRLEALEEEVARGKTEADAEGGEIAMIVRTFSEMSPKNAASILEKLNPNLAATILDSLDNEFRARTLAKMEAEVAAGLMERIKKLQDARKEKQEREQE